MLSFRLMYNHKGRPMYGGEVQAGFRLRSTQNLLEILSDLGPEMQRIRTEFAFMEQAWFRSEGEGSWANLRKSTVDRKANLGLPIDALVATRELFSSLTDSGHPDAVQELSSHSIRMGTRVPHAYFHERGWTHYRAGWIDPRPPIPHRTEHPELFRFIRNTVAAGIRERMSND